MSENGFRSRSSGESSRGYFAPNSIVDKEQSGTRSLRIQIFKKTGAPPAKIWRVYRGRLTSLIDTLRTSIRILDVIQQLQSKTEFNCIKCGHRRRVLVRLRWGFLWWRWGSYPSNSHTQFVPRIQARYLFNLHKAWTETVAVWKIGP